jgi:RimJ/RimL family protein N-acetyltransferase
MMRLEGERVALRPLQPEELGAALEARDRPEPHLQPPRPVQRERIQRRLARSGRLVRGHLDLAIEADGRLIGEIQARRHPAQTLPAGVYEVGIMLYEQRDRGNGYGREAVALLTNWLFDHAGAARVQASTPTDNRAMCRVLERLGFSSEGVMRAFMPTAAGRTDFALYAATRDDWQGQSAATR